MTYEETGTKLNKATTKWNPTSVLQCKSKEEAIQASQLNDAVQGSGEVSPYVKLQLRCVMIFLL